MFSEERRRLIVERLKGQRGTGVEALAEGLGVSRETVRRDLLALEAEGVLRRVHGGAVLTTEMQPEPPLARRMKQHRPEKEAIAQAVAAMLRPGQTLFIDAGSTTALLALALAPLSGLTILTNSPDVALALRSRQSEHEIMLLGGWLRQDIPGVHGESTMAEIMRFNADLALIAPMALHPTEGATNYMVPEAEIARLMIQRSRKTVMMAVSGKLGQISRAQICACTEIDLLVTDFDGSSQKQDFLLAGVKEVIVAGYS